MKQSHKIGMRITALLLCLAAVLAPQVSAAPRPMEKQPVSVSDIRYNDGAGASAGPNMLSFYVSRRASYQVERVFDIVVSAGLDQFPGRVEKAKTRVVLAPGVTDQKVTLGNVYLQDLGSLWCTTIQVYEGEQLVSTDHLLHDVAPRIQQPGDVVYRPVGNGKFIYCNNPEYITEQDLLDPDLGNAILMQVDDVQGEYVLYGVFTNTNSLLPFSVDLEAYNPSGQPAEIAVSSIGIKTTDFQDADNYLGAGYNSTAAWMDFLGLSVDGYDPETGYETAGYYDNPTRPGEYYESYAPKEYAETISLPPGGSRWLLEKNGLRKRLGTYYSPDMAPASYALVMRFTVTGGPVQLNLAAFHDPAATANIRNARPNDYLYKPRGKFGTQKEKQAYWDWFKTRQNGKYFDAFWQDFAHVRSLVAADPAFLQGDGMRQIILNIEDRDDLYQNGWTLFTFTEQQYLQFNGVANSLPEVHADMVFDITDDKQAGERLGVRVFNQYHPAGYNADTWITGFNPQRNEYSAFQTAESDMLAFDYQDSSRWWYFDPFTSSAQEGVAGNTSRTRLNINLFAVEGPNSLNAACNLQNYGVTTSHTITFRNHGSRDRTVAYQLSTISGVIVRYDLHDGRGEQVRLKTTFYDDRNLPLAQIKTQEILRVTVPAGQEATIDVSTLLTNMDVGAFENILVLED